MAAGSLAAPASTKEDRSMTTSTTRRKVTAIRTPPQRHWVGDGFPVRTMVSYYEDGATISPFLLLDYAQPAEFPGDGRRRGVGEHPHRGFETVTIAYQGEVEHRDSAGHAGRIGSGDVQWMTAASGVVHEEMHGRQFSKNGGVLEMAQIWVNLPARLKMSAPRYQDIVDKTIPAVTLANGAGTIRVIAGECMKSVGPAKTYTPVNLWDARFTPGGKTELTMPQGYNVMALVRRGGVVINGETSVKEGYLAILDRKGESFLIESPGDSQVLILGGEPIPEPVVGQGPFVMNTRDEIQQAITDYRNGRMGHLK
jgi:redox-sensitive bicupin YhaK (pirin superfamily)